MTLSTWQLVVVGILLAAWVVVLGGPALVDAYRWFNDRSRRRHDRQTTGGRQSSPSGSRPVTESGAIRRAPGDPRVTGGLPSSGESDSGLGGRVRHRWEHRPRPLQVWLAQDVVERRVQLLLAVAVATVASMLLAIALRGLFVKIFLMMLGLMAVSLAVAAYVGTVELRHHRAEARKRLASEGKRAGMSGFESTRLGSAFNRTGLSRSSDVEDFDDVDGRSGLEGYDGLDGYEDLDDIDELETPLGAHRAGTGRPGSSTMAIEGFRGGGLEPSLIFEPLNLHEIVAGSEDPALDPTVPTEPAGHGRFDDGFEVPINPELARELGLHDAIDLTDAEPDGEGEPGPTASDVHYERSVDGEDRGQDPTFTAAPEAGARQASARARSKKKRTARPIYIESTLDDDNQWKAANDQ